MNIADFFSIGILAIALGAQVFLRPLKLSVIRLLSLLSVMVILAILTYWTAAQYSLWKNSDSVSRFLLPPYQDISYFFFYVLSRVWAPYLISFAAAFLVFWTARYFNKKGQQRFFYPEEPYFMAMGVFLSGHPLWIFYLFAVLLIHFLISLGYFLISPQRERKLSFYYFWLPIGLLVIITKGVVLSFELVSALKL